MGAFIESWLVCWIKEDSDGTNETEFLFTSMTTFIKAKPKKSNEQIYFGHTYVFRLCLLDLTYSSQESLFQKLCKNRRKKTIWLMIILNRNDNSNIITLTNQIKLKIVIFQMDIQIFGNDFEVASLYKMYRIAKGIMLESLNDRTILTCLIVEKFL